MTQALNLGLLGNNVNTSGQVLLTTGVSGTLPVANGGTGATTLTANNVLLGNGTSAVQSVAPGASGNVLTSNGTTWTSGAPPVIPANSQTFTTSGTYNVPDGITRVKVTVIGAGGNGGTSSTSGCGSNGGGGGAGGYVVAYVGVTDGGTATVTVGVNTATRTSSFAGTTTITAAGGTNGANSPTGTSGLSGASSVFGLTAYSAGPSRTTNAVYKDGNVNIITSGSNNEPTGQVYGHGFGVAGDLRDSATSLNAVHTPLGFGAGGGGGGRASGITTGGIGRNGLVIVEW